MILLDEVPLLENILTDVGIMIWRPETDTKVRNGREEVQQLIMEEPRNWTKASNS